MTFGPKNAPALYTAMMQFLRDDWNILFNGTRHIIQLSQLPTNIICNDRIIIDDILLFFNHIPTYLHYFPALRKFLQNIVFHLNLVNVNSSRIEWNMLDMIWLPTETVPLLPSSLCFKNGLSHPTVSLFYHLLACVVFTTSISPGSKKHKFSSEATTRLLS